MSENLTRAECQERAGQINNVAYRVTLDLTYDTETFLSTTIVTFDARHTTQTWLDFIGPEVLAVTVNGQQVDTSAFRHSRIHLTDLAESNEVHITAVGRFMSTGEGLHRFDDPVDDHVYCYSQCEVSDCRRIFPVFEQPDIKAPLTLSVRVPSDWLVVSTGLGSAKPYSDNVQEWTFDPTPPLSSYLYTVIAGQYFSADDEYQGPHGTYPLRVLCRQSLSDYLDAAEIFAITKQGFAFFEDAFDLPYPFVKYDQIIVPEFNAGAMENPGSVTFNEDLYLFRSRVTDAAHESRAETILHEMAHMWFGDLVTMRWWDDLWLNESFAEWAAHHAASTATRFTQAWASFANQRKAWAYRQDQLPTTHPIAANMVDLDSVKENFDGITYAKGASVLKQLVSLVGEEDFLAGLRTYFRTHAYSNTSFSDLLVALQEATEHDLDTWSQEWLHTAGVNTLSATYDIDEEGRYHNVVIHQSLPDNPEGLAAVHRTHRLLVGLYDITGDDLVRREAIDVVVSGPVTTVPALDGIPRADLLLINDQDLTYAKIRLDDHSLGTAMDYLAQCADPLVRSLIWAAAWDMTRDAEMSTGNFVSLVASTVPYEADISLVGQIMRQVKLAVSIFADPMQRPEYQRQLAAAFRVMMSEHPAGSDHQLAALRGLIVFAGSEDISYLRRVLAGDESIPGITIDPDIRWAITTRLVSLGAEGSSAIDAALALDNTAAGHRKALTARAAAPDLEAKKEAWDMALDDTSLPNASLEATILGITQYDQGFLMRPFVERYFTALPRVLRSRTHEISTQILTGLYPTLLVEQATVDRTQQFLDANPDLPSGGRRLLLEAQDSLERALRCLQRDRAR